MHSDLQGKKNWYPLVIIDMLFRFDIVGAMSPTVGFNIVRCGVRVHIYLRALLKTRFYLDVKLANLLVNKARYKATQMRAGRCGKIKAFGQERLCKNRL